MIAEMMKFIRDRGAPLANEVICEYKGNAVAVLLATIALKLDEQLRASLFGREKFEITAYTLAAVPQKILVKDSNGRVRNVSVWVDSATGGPTPKIRVGKSATSANGGGVRVSAGQVNELGNVSPNVELWAASDTSIDAYVIERA